MALPGVNTIINDRFYTLSRTDIPLSTRVVIIGRRNDDASATKADEINDLEPYNASNEKTVIERFGATSDLHRGYLEAVSGGATRVTLIALPSDTDFDYVEGTISSAVWEADNDPDYVDDDPGNGLFHAAFAEAEAISADIIVPWGAGADPTFSDFATPATPADGYSDYYGFYANNSPTPGNSFAVKVANKCAEITANSHPCFAVMGVKPYDLPSNSDGSMLTSQLTTHLNFDPDDAGNNNLVDREDLENGIYLNIVVGELKPLGYEKNYQMGFANGAATYAGAISQIDAWSAPTGKTIYNIERIRYNPTRTQQENLISWGLVPVALNFNRTPVWVDAQTFGSENSDYTRLTTLRIVFDAVQMVRQVTQKFIGEASTIENRNAIETAITSGLRAMQQLGALLSSDFSISYVPAENKARVDLVLQPAFELRNVEISVAVQL